MDVSKVENGFTLYDDMIHHQYISYMLCRRQHDKPHNIFNLFFSFFTRYIQLLKDEQLRTKGQMINFLIKSKIDEIPRQETVTEGVQIPFGLIVNVDE